MSAASRWVSVAMLQEHSKKSRSAVIRALAASGTKTEKLPGVRGLRIKFNDANSFLAKHWPHIGPLQINN